MSNIRWNNETVKQIASEIHAMGLRASSRGLASAIDRAQRKLLPETQWRPYASIGTKVTLDNFRQLLAEMGTTATAVRTPAPQSPLSALNSAQRGFVLHPGHGKPLSEAETAAVSPQEPAGERTAEAQSVELTPTEAKSGSEPPVTEPAAKTENQKMASLSDEEIERAIHGSIEHLVDELGLLIGTKLAKSILLAARSTLTKNMDDTVSTLGAGIVAARKPARTYSVRGGKANPVAPVSADGLSAADRKAKAMGVTFSIPGR